jgi:hypothetical protein
MTLGWAPAVDPRLRVDDESWDWRGNLASVLHRSSQPRKMPTPLS